MKTFSKKIDSLFADKPYLNLDFEIKFEPETNFELIRNLSSQTYLLNDQTWNLLISRLSPFFESVALCKDDLICDFYFKNQKIRSANWKVTLDLPHTKYLQILKTDGSALFQRLFNSEHDNNMNWNGFIFDLGRFDSQHIRFLLFCSTAEPWLSLKIEALVETFQKLHVQPDDE